MSPTEASVPRDMQPVHSGFPKHFSGRPMIGCTLGFGTTFSAQLLARVGYDWVLIDMEHNPLSAQQVSNIVHAVVAASGGSCLPFVRVPSSSMEWIKWALDSGASGIIVPMCQSERDAQVIVQFAAYPPLGQRSFGPMLAPFASLDPTASSQTYFSVDSKRVQIIPMIESVESVQNAEGICSVPGITSIFVGPLDLRLSMGLDGPKGNEPEYLSALQRIIKTCKKNSISVGIFASGEEECRQRINEGFDYLLCPGEAALLVRGAKASLAESLAAVQG